MTPAPLDPTLPARLREFHARLPLAGDPPNAVLALPDDRLLYLASLLRDTPVPAPALSPEEWQAFLDLLRPHGVYPLMAYRLRTWPAECRPPLEVMDYLNRVFLYAAARAMRAGRQIQVAVDALEAAGIPSVLLKGPALARTVYPDPALRQSVDIDLLVRPGDVLAAEKVLEGLGYVSPKKEFHVSQHEFHHQVFEPPTQGMTIELHWALDFAYDLFCEDWFENAIASRNAIVSEELSFYTLKPSDHLLFLAFHDALQHDSLRLDWICDANRLLAEIRTPSEWEALIDQAVANHIRIPLELLIQAASLWAGIETSNRYLNPASWPAPLDREVHVWAHAKLRHTSLLAYLWLVMQGQPSTIEKIRVGCRFVMPPVAMLTPYRKSDAAADIPLAYLRRWGSIVKK